MKFEWNEKKSISNYKKHSIRFEEAQTVFLDPRAIEFFDVDHSQNEDRFIRLGCSENKRVILVIFCERGIDVIRIISARKATVGERMFYEKGIQFKIIKNETGAN